MKTYIPFLFSIFVMPVMAGEVTIVDANASKRSNTYHFNVTLKHADTGWDHYADQWQVLTPDHKVLGTRTLYHPHVKEQPFTRSLGGVSIPADISTVIIQARDTVHGVSSQEFPLKLP
ncbi:MAG: hypothetical protein OQL16_09410 [Gammaproteobacteria bacterium]|nr:hypothetical protein [Gammaproteobacteria bacterium]